MNLINKKVAFNDTRHTFFYECDKQYSFIPNRIQLKKTNRKLRKIERYMKKINLLFKNEMLEFVRMKQIRKHIRGDFINFIAKDLKMISKRQYLNIVT